MIKKRKDLESLLLRSQRIKMMKAMKENHKKRKMLKRKLNKNTTTIMMDGLMELEIVFSDKSSARESLQY